MTLFADASSRWSRRHEREQLSTGEQEPRIQWLRVSGWALFDIFVTDTTPTSVAVVAT